MAAYHFETIELPSQGSKNAMERSWRATPRLACRHRHHRYNTFCGTIIVPQRHIGARPDLATIRVAAR
jgi:hypothetical protein